MIAIIGVGSIGSVLAGHLVRGGEDVVLASADFEHAQAVATEVGARATLIDDAIDSADIVVFAVWFAVLKQLLTLHSGALRGKVIVDPSNPVAFDDDGRFKKIIPADESAGEILAALMPPDARLVKAFGTQSAATLAGSSDQQPPIVQFYATDDEGAGATVAGLIRTAGFTPMSLGGINQSARIEIFGDLHEVTLGATFTAEEAKTRI
ncbi:MAG: NADPH-dependent F420 reductase [Nocardioidaceae bacterium]